MGSTSNNNVVVGGNTSIGGSVTAGASTLLGGTTGLPMGGATSALVGGATSALVGGMTSTAIAPATGGAADGGTTGVSAGGALSTGGNTTLSSIPTVGGAAATGGAAPNGGAPTGGAAVVTGATGGELSTGGAPVTGGAVATGGISATGGAPVTGGDSGTGGGIATGGLAATGGTTASTACDGVTCSGHGECISTATMPAICKCYNGYHTSSDGVACLAPAMTVSIDSNLVTNGSAAPSFGKVGADGSKGLAGGPLTITLGNTGDYPLTVSSVTLTGTNTGDFAVTTAPTSAIDSGGTGTVKVVFDPQTLDAKSAVLNIASNDLLTPKFTLQLSGIGRPVAFLFDGGGVERAIGGRSGADQICTAARPASITSTATNVHALLSVDSSDTIANMPTNYGLYSDSIVISPTSVILANNWADLLNGTISTTLVDAHVTSASFWYSGANSDGTFNANNCSGWSATSGSPSRGAYGQTDLTTSSWISAGTAVCGLSTYHVLCLAY